MGGMTPQRTRRDIQGLRAVAVGLVLADHAGIAILAGGFIGVDVFFVISGFLITRLLVAELHRSGRVSVAGFYARRARRILPAGSLVLATIVLYSAFALLVTRAAEIGTDVLWAAAFLANVHFAQLETDYFAAGTPPSPVQHFWSLAVEEQFYVVWPAVLALLAWAVARRLRGDRESVIKRVLSIATGLVAAVWVASLAWSIVVTASSPAAAYFSTPARSWELATGALLALAEPRLRGLARPLAAGLGLAGLVGIAVPALAYDHHTPFPGAAALAPVLGTAAVLVAGMEHDALGAARVLALRPVQWVGDISYSLYLWHWPVLLLGRHVVSPLPQWAGALVLVAAAVALAALTFRLVEQPFRQGRFWRPTARGLLLWPAALCVTALAVQLAGHHAEHVLAERAEAAAAFDPTSVPLDQRTPRTGDPIHDALADSLDRAAVAAPIPFPLDQDLTELAKDRAFVSGDCSAATPDSSHTVCPVGAVGAGTRVVVLGDSHAHMWLPAVAALGEERGFEVDPLIKWGCSPFALAQTERGEPGPFTACEQYRTWALGQIRELGPDLVIVSSRAYPGSMLFSGQFDPAEWRTATDHTVASIVATGAPVVVMGDVPELAAPPDHCLADPDATMATCTGRTDPAVAATNDAVAEGARLAGAPYVDVTSLVCLRGRCPMVADHIAVFRDPQHLSETWVRHVASAWGGLFDLP